MLPAAFAAVSLIDDAVDEVDEVDGVDDEPVVEPDVLPAPVLVLDDDAFCWLPEPGFEALVALMPLPSVDF